MYKAKVKLNDIIDFLGDMVLKVQGHTDDIEIERIASLELNTEKTLDWVNITRSDKQSLAEKSSSRALVVDSEIEFSEVLKKQGKVLIKVLDPRHAVAIIGNQFFLKSQIRGIDTTAKISFQAKLAPGVNIGANVVIGECEIGANTTIMPNTVIHDGVIIGANVLIQAGVVLGTDGLGCTREADGSLIKFPHLGGLIIEDNVEIGANTTVAKGAFGNTIIGRGSKINALCYIGHNCHIGANVLIAGGTNLNGSVKIGKNSVIYSNCVVREQTRIGERVIIGMGSVVTKKVPDDEIWVGNPARLLRRNEG